MWSASVERFVPVASATCCIALGFTVDSQNTVGTPAERTFSMTLATCWGVPSFSAFTGQR